jgi:uncharacterized membrane protein
MKKHEYIGKLENALAALPVEERTEILADYHEHFEMAMADGQSEESICEALGSPEHLAKQYRVRTLVARAEEEPSSRNLLRAIVATLGLGFFNIVFLLGPFLALCGVLVAFFAVAVGFFVAGFAIIIGGLLSSVFTIFSGMALGGFFLGAGFIALSLAMMLIGVKVGQLIYRLTLRYLKMNSQIIKGER